MRDRYLDPPDLARSLGAIDRAITETKRELIAAQAECRRARVRLAALRKARKILKPGDTYAARYYATHREQFREYERKYKKNPVKRANRLAYFKARYRTAKAEGRGW